MYGDHEVTIYNYTKQPDGWNWTLYESKVKVFSVSFSLRLKSIYFTHTHTLEHMAFFIFIM